MDKFEKINFLDSMDMEKLKFGDLLSDEQFESVVRST